MAGLRIDRPCRVHKAAAGRWEWTCLCSPAVWPCTGRETSWGAAQTAADQHMSSHRTSSTRKTSGRPRLAVVASLASVTDLSAYRAAKTEKASAGARVLEFPIPAVRPGGDVA